MFSIIVGTATVGVVGCFILAWFFAGRTELIATAHLANDIERLFTVKDGTEIKIVGYDLRCIIVHPNWMPLLTKWIKAGATIEYLVQDTQDLDAALKRLGNLKRLTVRRVKKNTRNESIFDGAETFHWTLCLNPDQLWIEGMHKPGEVIATGCEYRRVSRSNKKFVLLNKMYDDLASQSTQVYPKSSNADA